LDGKRGGTQEEKISVRKFLGKLGNLRQQGSKVFTSLWWALALLLWRKKKISIKDI